MKRALLGGALLTVGHVGAGGGSCEEWCTASCDELNGPWEYECADCPVGYACRPGGPSWVTSPLAITVETDGRTFQWKDGVFTHVGPTWATGREASTLDPDVDSRVDYWERIQQWRQADLRDPGLQKTQCTKPTSVDEREPIGCASVHYTALNRSALLAQRTPLIITGLTEGWPAHERWELEALRKRYGNHPFKLTPKSHTTIDELLDQHNYGLAHAERDGCYNPHSGAYSPFLLASIQGDYEMPPLLQPPNILQMAVGWQSEQQNGNGLGVPPEAHSSAWLAQIKGRKRWVFHPPSVSKPCGSVVGASCSLGQLAPDARVCEHGEGEIMWVPEGWWHETCTRGFSIAVGALTTLTASGFAPARPCGPGEYTTADLDYCATNSCPGLG